MVDMRRFIKEPSRIEIRNPVFKQGIEPKTSSSKKAPQIPLNDLNEIRTISSERVTIV